MSRHQQGRIRLPEDAQAELTRRRAQSERITGIFIRQIYTNLAGFTRCRVGSVRGPWVLDLGPFDQATAAARTAKLGRAWRSGTIAAPKEWAYPSYPPDDVVHDGVLDEGSFSQSTLHDRFTVNLLSLVFYLLSQGDGQSHAPLKIGALLEPQVVAFEGWSIDVERQIAVESNELGIA